MPGPFNRNGSEWLTAMRFPQGNTETFSVMGATPGRSMVDWKRQLTRKLLFFFQIFFGFGWGALPPRPPGFWLGGQSPPNSSLKRSFVTFDRGGQTGPPRSNYFFFGAADDTRAADDRPPGPVTSEKNEKSVLRKVGSRGR